MEENKRMREKECFEALENGALNIWGPFLSKRIKIKRKSLACMHIGHTFCSPANSASLNDFPQGRPSLAGLRFPESCPRWAQPLTLDGHFSASLLHSHVPTQAESSGHPGPSVPFTAPVPMVSSLSTRALLSALQSGLPSACISPTVNP